MSLWEYFELNPERGSSFNALMTIQREGRESWLDSYPLMERISPNAKHEEDAVLMVDIGGGRGHELQEFQRIRKSLPGRLIVQDLPSVIADIDVKKDPGFETQEYDLFSKQPVRGGKPILIFYKLFS